MPRESLQSERVEQVRALVREELCQRNQLERHAFQMTEKVVLKQGKLCGLFFCIHGPRSVRLTALWDVSREAIILYDSLGRRAAIRPLTVPAAG